jgi:hypothetical protein
MDIVPVGVVGLPVVGYTIISTDVRLGPGV